MSPGLLLTLMCAPALAGALLALGLDAFDRPRDAVALAALGLLASGGVGMWAGLTANSQTAWAVLRVGSAYSTVTGVILLLAGLVLVGGWSEFTSRPGGGSTAALIALAAVGSAGMVLSCNLVMLLISVEIVAAAGYALVAEARTPQADEAAMKYFIQGALATGLFVMGMAVLVGGYVPSGTYALLIDALSKPIAASAAMGGALLIISALAFKASIAPFHSWAPDSYQSARPEVAAFLSAGPKLGAIGALGILVVYFSSGALHDQIVIPLAVLAGLSVLVGSLGALRQTSYTRMLGYAGVAQAGYALIGVVILNPTSALFFAATYAIATAGTFLAATAFHQARPEWDGSVQGLSGMGRHARIVSASVAILLVSLAGIPPFLGFWGKFQVFAGAITVSGRYFLVDARPAMGWVFAVLAIVGLVGSVISLVYYGGVLRALYSYDDAPPIDVAAQTARSSASATIVVAGLAVVVVLLGLIPLFAGIASIVLPFTVK